MPVYNFKCQDCGQRFEFMTFTMSEKVYCINCKSENLKKIPSRFGFSNRSEYKLSSSTIDACSGCTSSACSSCKTK